MRRVMWMAVLCCLASAASAEVSRFKVRPDGQIRFEASADGPTRLSVKGDRIAKVLQSESNFEMTNDANTGDVFLRFVGGELDRESGYIVTEAGHTIGFVMEPRRGLDTQTVLIELTGVRSAASAASSATQSSAAPEAGGFAVDSSGGAGGYAADLVSFTREAIARRIGLKSPAGIATGRTYATYAKGGLRARIFAARKPSGARIAPQSFYAGPRTLAVYVDDTAVSGKVWVVVVESAR